jgi:FMN phosphatase YigB (HAD superfamily)
VTTGVLIVPGIGNSPAASVRRADRFVGSARISIDQAGIYKPVRDAYNLATTYLGLDAASIGFVSSNAWDIAGALRSGFVPVWVNRHRLPNEYGLRGNVHQADRLIAASEYFRAVQ